MSYGREPLTTRKTLIEIARKRLGKRAPDSLRVVKDMAALVQPLGERSFRFTLSTSTIDRAADRVDQAGWDLVGYKRNPVVLWMHDARMPIGRGVDVRVEGGRLKATVVLDAATVPVVGPFAEMVKQKLQAGSLFACSVGFRPLDFDVADNRGIVDPGMNFKRQELTEWSIVSVPCNPDSLVDETGGNAALLSVTARAPGKRLSRDAFLRRLAFDARWSG